MPVLGLFVLLASLAAPVSAAGTFTNKADLQAALELVVCDKNDIHNYGAPDTWDVSAVTDMELLIIGLSCRASFNEVRTLHVTRVGVLSQLLMARQPLMASSDCCADYLLHHSQAIGSWDVSSVTSMKVRRAPPAHYHGQHYASRRRAVAPHPLPACGVLRRCLPRRPPSTSRSTRGTSARSRTWGCVARCPRVAIARAAAAPVAARSPRPARPSVAARRAAAPRASPATRGVRAVHV